LKNEILYSLSSGSVTINTVPPPLPLTFNILFRTYIHHCGFIPLPSQNHVLDDFKIHLFRRVVIEGYAPYFTDGLTVPGHSIEHRLCIVLWSPHSQIQLSFEKGAIRR